MRCRPHPAHDRGVSQSSRPQHPPAPALPLLPRAEIQILKRSDGGEWRLGAGGFGTVYKAMRNGVQPVAVKVLGVVSGDRDWGQLWARGVPGHAALLLQPSQILQGLPGQLCAPHKLNSAQTQPHTLHGSASPPPSSSLFACPAGQQRGGQVDVGRGLCAGDLYPARLPRHQHPAGLYGLLLWLPRPAAAGLIRRLHPSAKQQPITPNAVLSRTPGWTCKCISPACCSHLHSCPSTLQFAVPRRLLQGRPHHAGHRVHGGADWIGLGSLHLVCAGMSYLATLCHASMPLWVLAVANSSRHVRGSRLACRVATCPTTCGPSVCRGTAAARRCV